MKALVIGLLGAESTGKTTLSVQLAQALRDQTGLRCAVVDESLRAWCERTQRTPRGEEQHEIALEQHCRIEEAAAAHDIVIADTTALMTAAYSHLVWADAGLDAWATQLHAQRVDVTLLTALDLPWTPDGLQRDGPHVREPVDTRLRGLLAAGGIAWSRIGGAGPARLCQALAATRPAVARLACPHRSPGLFCGLNVTFERDPPKTPDPRGARGWRPTCDLCDDPECERALQANAYSR